MRFRQRSVDGHARLIAIGGMGQHERLYPADGQGGHEDSWATGEPVSKPAAGINVTLPKFGS